MALVRYHRWGRQMALPMSTAVPAHLVREFREVGRLLWEAGLVSSHGGNMSVRLPDGSLVVTRHGAMLGRLGEEDLVLVTPEGAQGEPSMDTALHRAIYGAADAWAVVHAHPPHAVALSLDGDPLRPLDLEGRHHLGEAVPVAQGPEGLVPALASSPVALWRGHGSYARGRDLWQALLFTSVLEESARVLWLRRALR